MIEEKEIRRINRRYSDIVKKFGKGSQYAQPYEQRLQKLQKEFGEEFIFTSKEGILQISKGKKTREKLENFKDDLGIKNVNTLLKLSNVQEIQKRVAETLKEEGIKPQGKRGKFTEKQIKSRLRLENRVNQAIEELSGVNYNDDDNLKKMLLGTQRGGTNKGKLSADEMREIIKKYEIAKKKEGTLVDLPF